MLMFSILLGFCAASVPVGVAAYPHDTNRPPDGCDAQTPPVAIAGWYLVWGVPPHAPAQVGGVPPPMPPPRGVGQARGASGPGTAPHLVTPAPVVMLRTTMMDDFPGMVIANPEAARLLNGCTIHVGCPSVANVARLGRLAGTPVVQ